MKLQITHNHYHHHPAAPSETALLQTIKELVMAVSAQVQAVLDKATQAVTIEQQVVLGLQAQGAQIANLNEQIAALQVQVAAGATLGADDIAALATTGQDLDTVNQALTNALPPPVVASAAASTAAASAQMTSTGPAIVSSGAPVGSSAPSTAAPSEPAAPPAAGS